MDDPDVLLKIGIGGLILVLLVREGINFVKWTITRKNGSNTPSDNKCQQAQYYMDETQREIEELKSQVRDCLKLLRLISDNTTKLFDMHNVRENGQYIWYGSHKVCENMTDRLKVLLAKMS